MIIFLPLPARRIEVPEMRTLTDEEVNLTSNYAYNSIQNKGLFHSDHDYITGRIAGIWTVQTI
jgi:hypothetical protein